MVNSNDSQSSTAPASDAVEQNGRFLNAEPFETERIASAPDRALARRSGVWRLFFDRAEYDLVDHLERLEKDEQERASMRRLFEPCFHPHGIKELAAPAELRTLLAMFHLLDTFDTGAEGASRRIAALRALRSEVIDGATSLELPHNSARVQLQLTKELIRANDRFERLKLARDLRSAIAGRPLFIRRTLKRYFLLEMPESWNQLTFDYHVHDVNTKGRKSPTHLIMDAWIKGIRELQVIYYNYVPVAAATELLQAAEIMEMDVRIGVEYSASWRGRFVGLIGSPPRFSGDVPYLKQLHSERMQSFAAKAAAAAGFRTRQVLKVLDLFNTDGLARLNRDWQLNLAPIAEETFLASVRYGQPSLEHLAELVVAEMSRELSARGMDPRRLETTLTADRIEENYFDETPMRKWAGTEDELPELCRMSPAELSAELRRIAPDYSITLNLSGLTLADAVEILYECEGRINVLELFNLRDVVRRDVVENTRIDAFRRALNQHDVIRLKSILRALIDETRAAGFSLRADREEAILRDLERFIGFYENSSLAARLGSDSSSRSRRYYGMGMVIVDSLPSHVREELRRGSDPERELLAVDGIVRRSRVFEPGREPANASVLRRFRRKFRGDGYYQDVFQCEELRILPDGGRGNVATLGGFYQASPRPVFRAKLLDWIRIGWTYGNSKLKNALKILLGFLPAFLTFYWSQDWWLLAWGGAFIWFGITGVRNVIQAVLGGGGLRRPRHMRWNEFVSVERVADSLMFTGLSVPLLEFVVKTLLLRRVCGFTAEADPVTVYSAIAVANGLYIYAHNVWRGFSRTATIGNVFRPLIAIPLAVFASLLLERVLPVFGVADVAVVLQLWAAILSKASSDCAAALIEGYADGERNRLLRLLDYRGKFKLLFHNCFILELRYPADGVGTVFRRLEKKMEDGESNDHGMVRSLTIDALDLMYFWMYQPRAVVAFRRLIRELSTDELELLGRSQMLLFRKHAVGRMLKDGLIGNQFVKALDFYSSDHPAYLKQLASTLAAETARREVREKRRIARAEG